MSSNYGLETLVGRVIALQSWNVSTIMFWARAILVMLQQVLKLEGKLFCDKVLQDSSYFIDASFFSQSRNLPFIYMYMHFVLSS